MYISPLQQNFINFLKTKKTFNFQILKERTKWQYKLTKDLVQNRDMEISVYKQFLETVKREMYTKSVYYLSAVEIIEIYKECISQNQHITLSLSTKEKNIKIRIAGFCCSNCFLDNDSRYVYVSATRSKIYKYKSTCIRCKTKNLTSIVE